MRSLTVYTGLDFETSALEVEAEAWPKLEAIRSDFCRTQLKRDCRRLVFYLEDAKQTGNWMGHGSREAYIQNGLKLDVAAVDAAVLGLAKLDPKEPITFDDAITLGTPGGQPGNKNAAKNVEPASNKNEPVANRFVYGSTNAPYLLARLERDNPGLAARVRAGELSANAAAIEAGWRHKPTPLDQLRSAWRRASAEERAEFREWLAQQ